MKKIFEGQLLVSDFDGTLVNSKHAISEENLKAIRFFAEQGGLFCGATGRTPYNIAHYLKGLPLNCPWILFNGACLYDFCSNTYRRTFPLSKDPLEEIILKMITLFPSICVHIYTKDKFYLVNQYGKMDKYVLMEKQSFEFGKMEKIHDPWIKVLLHDSHEVLKKALDFLNSNPGSDQYHAFFSIDTYLEITRAEVSKGFALNLLRQELGGRVKRVIAIGDYLNDAEMLGIADFSAAPENAHDEIKMLAQHITPHHDQNAVASLITFLSHCA